MIERELTCVMFLFGLLAGPGGCATTPKGKYQGAPPEQGAVSEPAIGDPMVSVDTLLPAPADFALTRIGSDEYPVVPYAEYLEGVKICLDPGHGGLTDRRGYKRGPTGVREAEMNLRVAGYLRDFLDHVGAEVLLTREEDVDVSLEDRARMANDWGADLFISCHHNAVDNNPAANFTTVWYHRDVDHRPTNLDLARYLCQGLIDELALPTVTGVPLKSDQLMYETGFAVLRHADVTAALSESSFFTNPEEEQRLRDPHHNLREAYGLFLGLAKYALGGFPRTHLITPDDGVVIGLPYAVEFELDDGLRGRRSWGHDRQMILSGSIAVRFDGKLIAHEFVNDSYRLLVDLPADAEPGAHDLEVQFENMYKHSVLNPHFVVEIR